MREQSYEKYLGIFKNMYHDCQDECLTNMGLISDWFLGETTPFVKAIKILGADMHREITQASGGILRSSEIISKIYNPFSDHRLNYHAYRFVLKILADTLGLSTDVTVISIDEKFYGNTFDVSDRDPNESMDVARLRSYQGRLLDFSKSNQLVDFKNREKSCIEIVYPEVEDLIGLLLKQDEVYIEHWESLGLTRILQCSHCGSQFFKPFKTAEVNTSGKCPKCDTNERNKSAKPVCEDPWVLEYAPLTLRCEKCSCENEIADVPTKQAHCKSCGAALQFPSYPIFSAMQLKSRHSTYCIAGRSDGITKTAAKRLERDIKKLKFNYGLHPLYLACGFLKWKTPNAQEYTSPLLLVKIHVSVDTASGKYYISLDKTDSEPISLNHTLYKMLENYSREASMKLPQYPEGMSYQNYKIEVFRALQVHGFASDWQIEDQAVIGIFNYQKLQLEKELAEHFHDKYLPHPVIRLLGNFDESPVEPEQMPGNADSDFLVLDADGSQSRVIEAAMAGKSFILQGPPGTGKSQTISNIIAGAMSQGKTVLFVTEKTSARDIIWDNLHTLSFDSKRRLTDFIYSESSIRRAKSNSSKKASRGDLSKTDILNFFNEKFAAQGHGISMSSETFSSQHIEKSIRELYDGLSEPVDAYTIGSLIGIWSQYADEGELALPDKMECNIAELEHLKDRVSRFYRFASRFGMAYKNHPLYGYTERNLDIPSFRSIERAVRFENELQQLSEQFRSVTGIKLFPVYATMADELTEIEGWSTFPKEIWKWLRRPSVTDAPSVDAFRGELESKKRHAVERQKARNDAAQIRPKAHEFESKVKSEHRHAKFNEIIAEFYQFDNPFRRLGKSYKQAKKQLQSYLLYDIQKLSYKTIINELYHLLSLQTNYLQCCDYESRFSKDEDMFFELAKGWETDWDQTVAMLSDAVRAMGGRGSSVSRDMMEYLKNAGNYESAMETLCSGVVRLRSKLREMTDAITDTASAFDKQVLDVNSASHYVIFCKFNDILQYREGITDWVRLQSFLYEIRDDQTTQDILDTLQQMQIQDKDRAIGMLCKAYYRKIIHTHMPHGLSMFDRGSHEEMLEQYGKNDVGKMHCDAVTAYNSLLANKKKACDALRDKTKLRSHLNRITVKQFIRQYWDVIRTLTPCFMMSPLSVSQYLDIDLPFDLVIFDEASQIFFEDSLASIVRGAQLIVSGDRQQLPPSDFFKANGISSIGDGDMDYDDESEDEDRSVLDASIRSSIKEISLKWHYRSRDESLISFSNAYFYSNSLITFPAADRDPDLRMILHAVPDGKYLSGKQHTNPREVETVVQLLWNEITCPERKHFTVGVVAFSVAQANAIEEGWIKFVSSLSPQDKAVLQSWETMEEHKKEPLIFCNLDTVQGDERDTMIVSTTYGKNENDEFSLMYLGPVRQANGGKRINVAITRAKSRMLVVTSMSSDMLSLYLSKSAGRCNDGAEILCDFLKYAETYENEQHEGCAVSNGDTRTPLVDSICKILDECGAVYDVGVGLSNCKVDIGIKSSADSNVYTLGIVTDEQGLSVQSVREYARLREQVLSKRYGWNLYHIWSASWFLDHKTEKQMLIDQVKRVMAAHRS